LQECRPDQVGVSAVSFAEFVFGYRKNPAADLKNVMDLFERIPVMPFDRMAAVRYAAIPFRRGRFDRLIAAHALALRATLVTNNPADFDDIPNLRMENWLEEDW